MNYLRLNRIKVQLETLPRDSSHINFMVFSIQLNHIGI